MGLNPPKKTKGVPPTKDGPPIFVPEPADLEPLCAGHGEPFGGIYGPQRGAKAEGNRAPDRVRFRSSRDLTSRLTQDPSKSQGSGRSGLPQKERNYPRTLQHSFSAHPNPFTVQIITRYVGGVSFHWRDGDVLLAELSQDGPPNRSEAVAPEKAKSFVSMCWTLVSCLYKDGVIEKSNGHLLRHIFFSSFTQMNTLFALLSCWF